MGTHLQSLKSNLQIHFSKMAPHKSLKVKKVLAKAQKQNRPLPQWFRFKTGNKIRYNAKRRHWKRTKLGLEITKEFYRSVQPAKHLRSEFCFNNVLVNVIFESLVLLKVRSTAFNYFISFKKHL